MRFDNASTVVYYCLIQMNIINLGILAHIDAGKTSVTENLLFASGATEKCGRVDNGDTITDSMDIEKRRLSGNFWLVSFKISYLCLPLFHETRTTPSCHPSGCAYRQL